MNNLASAAADAGAAVRTATRREQLKINAFVKFLEKKKRGGRH